MTAFGIPTRVTQRYRSCRFDMGRIALAVGKWPVIMARQSGSGPGTGLLRAAMRLDGMSRNGGTPGVLLLNSATAFSWNGISLRRSSGWFRSSAADVAVNKRRGKKEALFSRLLVGGGGRLLCFRVLVAAREELLLDERTWWPPLPRLGLEPRAPWLFPVQDMFRRDMVTTHY
jgi:hypothetical protein